MQALLLPALFDALYRKDQAEVASLAEKIGELETEADRIKSTYRHNMPKTLLLSVDRKDLLSLIHEQDALADGVETISQIMRNRDMTVPEAIKGGLDELLEGTMEIRTDKEGMVPLGLINTDGIQTAIPMVMIPDSYDHNGNMDGGMM